MERIGAKDLNQRVIFNSIISIACGRMRPHVLVEVVMDSSTHVHSEALMKEVLSHSQNSL